jgi:hypothetical protein
MSKQEIDRSETASAINSALALVARSAIECGLLSGSMRGPLGAALAGPLAEAAAESVRDLRRLSEALALLDATPSGEIAQPALGGDRPDEMLDGLVSTEEETLQALVDAIPADADDVLGESLEHVLEHAVMRRAEVIATLRRARG